MSWRLAAAFPNSGSITGQVIEYIAYAEVSVALFCLVAGTSHHKAGTSSKPRHSPENGRIEQCQK